MVYGPPLPLVLLWLAWIGQAAASALQVYRLHRQLKRPIRRKFQLHRPRTTVIVPFKGIDDDLPANIKSLCQQDYPKYQLVCVVESEQDAAYAVLVKELARYSDPPSRILVAGLAEPNEGQKVHNQRHALAVLDPECADDEVWVFADSDAVPGPQWLSQIVGPLRRARKTAMSSSYRWLIPTASGQDRPSIWSHLASICNSSVACQLGRYSINQAWGGSMAIRVSVARRGNLRQRWVGALSDDYLATRMCRDLKQRIAFVAHCLVASPVQFDRRSLTNFARRQYLITRIASRWLYVTALAFMSLYVAGFVSAGGFLIAGAWSPAVARLWWWPVGALLVTGGLDQIRSSLRGRVIEQRFGPQMRQQLRITLFIDRWCTPLWMTWHWLMILSAAFGRIISWRGVRYRMGGLQDTQRL